MFERICNLRSANNFGFSTGKRKQYLFDTRREEMLASTRTLEHLKKQCFSDAKNTSPIEVGTGKLFRWKGNVASFVRGELEFRYLPSFGPVLFDSSGCIPCLLVNPVKNCGKLIELCNRKVVIRHPEFVAEVFVSNSAEKSLVHLLLNVEKAELDEVNFAQGLENSAEVAVPETELQEKDLSMVLDDSDESLTAAASWNQKIIPLKISSNFQAPNSDIICFVLVVLIDEGDTKKEELVWLILRGEHVTWKDLLIPYRTYNISISSEVPTDHFIRHRRSLFSFFDSWDKSYLHMVHHHKDLVKTNLIVNVPEHSKISALDEQPKISKPVEKWFRISDLALKSTNFASIYGIVKEVRFVEAWKSYSCSWCKKFENVFEELIQDDSRDGETSDDDDDRSDESKNEWLTPESNVRTPVHHFPPVRLDKPENAKIRGFGIRGGDTVRITLKKNYSNRVAFVFLKRWQSQYPAGLAEGVTVCFTDMNVQRTKKKYFYFISTPFTRVIHLEETGSKMHLVVQKWGNFCFPFSRSTSAKFWGILDLDLLTKVSISAKCKLCEKPFLQYRCTNVYCSNSQLKLNADYTVKAVARLFVRGIEGCISNSLYLTNENVQKYLCIPDRIWQKLKQLSASSELYYLCSNTEIDETKCDIANIYFQKYCKYFRPRPRFHVHCKPFKDDENGFFCLDLVEINESRVNSLRAAIERKSKSGNAEQQS